MQALILMSVGFVAVRAQYRPSWSMAQLSVGRNKFAAASVENVAVFAGGLNASALLCRERSSKC
jgi:hypothetical protein